MITCRVILISIARFTSSSLSLVCSLWLDVILIESCHFITVALLLLVSSSLISLNAWTDSGTCRLSRSRLFDAITTKAMLLSILDELSLPLNATFLRRFTHKLSRWVTSSKTLVHFMPTCLIDSVMKSFSLEFMYV